MRIVAGERGGTRLSAPRGDGTRPTRDRVREALFAILGDVEGADVLDAFAGSGALGLEALSRGAATAAFCETSTAALRALRENVEPARLRRPGDGAAGGRPAPAGGGRGRRWHVRLGAARSPL